MQPNIQLAHLYLAVLVALLAAGTAHARPFPTDCDGITNSLEDTDTLTPDHVDCGVRFL
ncbi:hypothetical protein K466DRAFT_590674 [Polyporus arcularius HHB13444]|uniref:Uncharacterized protein n=1 Tax=Polyporus arcularius HHB13444 TaxID=1314778 RepID=A0A5C3P8U6_9APHY|nr:hypothetical protein K466DRAFT_590674 [Polyporus arcularius HHB13444]